MPRVSREQAELNRQSVVAVSSRLFRERGFDGVSLGDLMGAAGLTHGGFYGQFESKDALAGEACAAAFEAGVERWTRRVAGKTTPADRRQALIEGHLSARSRNDPGTACASATLVNDVAREPAGSPAREAYVEGIEALLQILAAAQDIGDDALNRESALADLATMVGAIAMSRATSGTPLSDELLRAARNRLSSPPSRRSARKTRR